jgi:hypothetical protein
VPFTDSIVAIPEAYRDDLEPFEVSFVLDTDDPAIDLTQTVSVRALIQRSDGEPLEWAFDIASDPAPTASAITVTHVCDFADFFDTAGEPIAPGTYDVRFFVKLTTGERPLTKTWLPVQGLF